MPSTVSGIQQVLRKKGGYSDGSDDDEEDLAGVAGQNQGNGLPRFLCGLPHSGAEMPCASYFLLLC